MTKPQTNLEPDSPPAPAAGDAQPEVVSHADLLRTYSGSMYLHGIGRGSPLANLSVASLEHYVETYVRDVCGQQEANPILRTLVEHMILTHHLIGRLHCDGVSSPNLEGRRVNIQLATTLGGELRRLGAEIHQQLQNLQQKPIAIADFAREEKTGGRKSKQTGKRNVA